MSARPEDVIAGMVATTRHPQTGALMIGRGAKKRAADILAALHTAGYVIERDWQPIETAPRDGTEILTWDESGCRILHWCDAWTDIEGMECHATDWRPLPTPPKDTPDAP